MITQLVTHRIVGNFNGDKQPILYINNIHILLINKGAHRLLSDIYKF